MSSYHTTASGEKIKLEDIEIGHLINIIKNIQKKSINGVINRFGCAWGEADGVYYDEYLEFGDAVKRNMNWNLYIKELKRRSKAISYKELMKVIF